MGAADSLAEAIYDLVKSEILSFDDRSNWAREAAATKAQERLREVLNRLFPDPPKPLPASLSTRALRVLGRLGVRTLYELSTLDVGKVRACKGAGPKVIAELRGALTEEGLTFAPAQDKR